MLATMVWQPGRIFFLVLLFLDLFL